MNIRTSLVYRFLYTLCLMGCYVLSLYGQQQSDSALHFVDSLNQIINSKPPGSKAQVAVMEELRARLIPLLAKPSPFEQRYIVARLVQDLDYKLVPYKDLLLKQEVVISNKVLLLEKQIERWQDSIALVQQALITIIEDNEQNRDTREKAVFTLAKIHDTKVLDYLFDNEENLRFTEYDYDSGNNESWEQEVHRTAMVAISNEYYYKESTESEKWLLFNYLLHDLKQDGFREVVLLNYLLLQPEPLKSKELLLEFMHANADPGSKKLIEFFLPDTNKLKK